MKDTNTGDNFTLLDLPDIDFKDFPEVDFDLPPLDLELPDDFDLNLEGVDFDLHLEEIDLELNFNDILSDQDFDLPALDFSELPGLELYEGGTK